MNKPEGYVPSRRQMMSNGYIITEWVLRAQQWLKYTLSHEDDTQIFLDITAGEARELGNEIGNKRYEQV